MRVISGEARGRKLKAPRGYKTRPTSDRVREAIFDTLPHWLEGMKVLDLFAGSGAMGIEALSRGAARAVFVESSPVVSEVIKANLKTCAFTERAHVIAAKLPGVLKRVLKIEGSFDLIFIDPPYEKGLAEEALAMLASMDGTAANGLVVVEHSAKEEMPEEINPLRRIRIKKYGSTAISIYERKSL